jgi:hypothetical protein
MRFLETLAGAVFGAFSLFVLLLASVFAFGSIGKYVRLKNM